MAMILEWQPRLQKTADQKVRAPRHEGIAPRTAQVIIFSGVRYERMPDVSMTMVKAAKKNRKIA